MKAIILAGGLGTRISEETHLKPMIEIGAGIHSITGSYDEKVRYYLKNSSCSVIYCL